MNSRVCNINQQNTTYSVWQHTDTKKHVGWTECPCVGHTNNKTGSQQLGKVTLNLYNERITLGSKKKDNCRKYI